MPLARASKNAQYKFLILGTVRCLRWAFLYPLDGYRKKVSLEGISDSEMVAHTVLEFRDIVITFLSGIVREMQADTHVETDDDKGQVVA